MMLFASASPSPVATLSYFGVKEEPMEELCDFPSIGQESEDCLADETALQGTYIHIYT